MSSLSANPFSATQAQTAIGPKDEGDVENILLVDDLPGNLLVYRTILEDLGQNLVFATSGEEALKLVLKQEFAVILLDVNMPTMNGFETASLIRKRKKSARTPIIFLTAFTDEVSMSQGYASGAVDFLPTPIVREVLKAKVQVFIELSKMRRQAALQAEERVRREAAEESARKSAFLAMASERLAMSQSHVELLQTLVCLPVPEIVDIGIAWFRDTEPQVNFIEGPHIISENGGEPPSLADMQALESAVRQVIETGQSRFLNEIPELHPPQIPRKTLGSAFVLPLAVQGKTRGVLILGRRRSGRPCHIKDKFLVSDLAYRASLALENVLLLERIREADRRKDEFLGMLAHELRNPLAPIYNSLQLQKMLDPMDPRMGDLQNIIDRQVKHMGRLIDDLLDATRLAHGKILLQKERCDLTRIVRQTAEDYRSVLESGGLKLDIYTPDKPIWVNGDSTRLVQAVGNLLHNAHKFTMRGGVITVRLIMETGTNQASIVVSDTGIGIQPDMLRYVFDVFRQAEQGLDRSRGGLGLGLALVKGLTELHGGTVGATSQGLNKGAQFAIRLPVELKQDAVASEPLPDPVSYKGRRSILVIEDNQDAAESICLLLRLDGHEVKTAATATAGLEIASNFRPEIILCDIGLPGMDGYQIAHAIRQNKALSSAYIIALTGYGREKDRWQSLKAGFNLHLTKPINYDNLRAALARVETKDSPKREGSHG